MKSQQKTILPGSNKTLPKGTVSDPLSKEENIRVSVRIRRKNELNGHFETAMSHEAYQQQYGAREEDAAIIGEFAKTYHLTVAETDLARRTMVLSGKITDFEDAFGVKLNSITNEHGLTFRGRQGDIYVPEQLKDIVVGVFGLDNRPIARPMFKVAKKNGQFISHAQAPAAFTPDQLANIYGFPSGVNGKGETIAIIELGGGYREADITKYFDGLKIPAPKVSAVLIDGGTNSPSNANGADGEVMLDIEVAGGVAPGAAIVVYFTKNTDQGFLDAITSAVHDTVNKPSVVSISWGSAEVNWTSQALTNFDEAFKSAAALGVTVCVAAGDSGSSDGETDGKVHVDFPASSPNALACGGTSLTVSDGSVKSEVVWHDSATSASGGGVSEVFPVPDYQENIKIPVSVSTKFKGRGVPDVAANADPDTGYKVLVDGQELVIGGTSAVAPLMAGLIARINEQAKKPAGFIHPVIYQNPALCRDITEGNNKTTKGNKGYTAGKGWDACSGLGVLSKLSSGSNA